jgi:phthiocerol/phenolphthiocerol synthesis type-I polyketide synthase C
MTAVGLGEQDRARPARAVRPGVDSVEIAGMNSLNGVTASPARRPRSMPSRRRSNQRRVSYKRLDLDYAFHSPAMDAIRPGVMQSLADVDPCEAQIPFHSAVTGKRLEGSALRAAYWWRNIREPVLFESALRSIRAQGAGVFVEIGPHALLRGYLLQCLRDDGAQCRVIPTLLRDSGGPDRVWRTLFQAAIAGAAVDWKSVFPRRGRFVALPNYPWQRERYWHAVAPESGLRLGSRKEHPLLGYRVRACDWAWENRIDTLLNPMLADHVIGEATVMPGTGYAEMALAAARLWLDHEIVDIEELEMHAPLVLGDAVAKSVRLDIDPTDGRFTIRSRDYPNGEAWTAHAGGRISRTPAGDRLPEPRLTLPARAPRFFRGPAQPADASRRT